MSSKQLDSSLPHFAGLEVIKLLFMLNSAEHEIFSANKYENTNYIYKSANKYENANYSWHFHIY